ncbi:MAG: hypothetical protein KF767_11470 [Bdellovibrionaceae bacterium]|nr:hypothetical protein [Pseudobdellovibrionaceae bacterium]
MLHRPPLWFFSLIFFALPALSDRVVSSREDLVRLQGWDAHQRQIKDFDSQRQKDVGEVAKSRHAWEKERDEDLVEYRAWKKKQKAAMGEDGPEYQEYLRLQAEEVKRQERLRDTYLAERNDIRHNFSATVKVTELEELGIAHDPERVEWHKRNILAEKGKGSGSSGGRSSSPSRPSFPSNSGNDFIPPEFDSPPPPPPSVPPPPEFFEPDIPPPPPPPPPDGGFDVPPPPPAIDEGAPPPIFDDEF